MNSIPALGTQNTKTPCKSIIYRGFLFKVLISQTFSYLDKKQSKMKTTTLFTIALKLTGIVALWQFVQSLSGIVTGVGLFSLFAGNGGMHNSFMALIGFNMILNILVVGTFAFYSLCRTERLLILFKMAEPDIVVVAADKGTFFKALVLTLGVLITIHGIGGFLIYNFNNETRTEQNFNPQTNNFDNKTSSIQTETKNINYLAVVEILAGVLLLSNIKPFANRLVRKFADDEEKGHS